MKFINKYLTIVLLSLIPIIGNTQDDGIVIDKIIAKVDEHIILKSDLEKAYLQTQQSVKEKPGEDLFCMVLENIIINKMMLAKAKLDSVIVDEGMINGEFERRWAHFIKQFGSEETLNDFIIKSGQDPDDFKDQLILQIEEQLVVQKMESEITSGIDVSPGEVKKFFKEIPEDSLPLFSAEVEFGHIVRNATLGAQQKQEVIDQLAKLKSEIEKGADFCEIAKLFSQGPTGPTCGDLGWANRGDFVPEFETAALKLSPNKISNPIKTVFGFHIIQMLEIQGNRYHCRHILIKPSESQLDINPAISYLDSIRTLIVNDSISFQKAAKEYSEDKVSAGNGGMFTDQQTGNTKIPYEQLNFSLTQILDTMKVGSISSPIPFDSQGNGVDAVKIIYLKKKIPQHKADLTLDYQKIYKAALNEKKNIALNKWFDKTKKEVYIHIDTDYKDCQLMITQ